MDRDDLRTLYASRFADRASTRNNVWAVLVEEFFQPRVGERKDILDLGSGWGEFINRIQGSARYAMDLNPSAKERVNEGVIFFAHDSTERWPLADQSIDVVFSSNFFEHLPSKEHLSLVLREAFRCLRPGGRILCLGPNIRFTGGAYWDFFDHHIALSDRSLSEALALAGFAIDDVIDRLLPLTMSHSRLPISRTLVSWYLKLPWAWRIMGQQFLVTGRRP